jgi:hypothetical protein
MLIIAESHTNTTPYHSSPDHGFRSSMHLIRHAQYAVRSKEHQARRHVRDAPLRAALFRWPRLPRALRIPAARCQIAIVSVVLRLS